MHGGLNYRLSTVTTPSKVTTISHTSSSLSRRFPPFPAPRKLGAQVPSSSYAKQHYQQGPSASYAGDPYYRHQQQGHLPSANPPFHSTAPVQAQRPAYRDQWPQQQSQHYQYRGYDRQEAQDSRYGGEWGDRGEEGSNVSRDCSLLAGEPR
jgi:hypothetical protein